MSKDRTEYQAEYFGRVTKSKRAAAAAKRKAEQAVIDAQRRLAGLATGRANTATADALERAEARRARDAGIVAELDGVAPGAPLAPDTCEDGSDYTTWFWTTVEDFVTEVKTEGGGQGWERTYHDLNMSRAGRCLLKYFGIPLLGYEPQGWGDMNYLGDDHLSRFNDRAVGELVLTFEPTWMKNRGQS